MFDIVVVGGGAAGFFAALTAKELAPHLSVTVLEKNNALLAKVRISGGGRCNVTHACFDPQLLVKNYPRGYRELLGPFHTFQPQHTIEWFEKRGVQLKTEVDGRMFPTTDSSSTIIDALIGAAHELGVTLSLQEKIEQIEKVGDTFEITMRNGEKREAKKLILATGSSREGYAWAQHLGHTLQEPVPSLFTFNIKESPLQHLSGIAVDPVEVRIQNSKFIQKGPLLITHFGFSGPAVLKLSAWGARFLHDCNYHAEVAINWLPAHSEESIYQILCTAKQSNPQKLLGSCTLFQLPKSLWRALLEEIPDQKLITLSDKRLRKLSSKLHCDTYPIEGKTTHKEEFVTCGGITLNEIDFKTLQSKKTTGLFFAGEILDIDGITGGFNFQNAWTTGYIAGKHSCS